MVIARALAALAGVLILLSGCGTAGGTPAGSGSSGRASPSSQAGRSAGPAASPTPSTPAFADLTADDVSSAAKLLSFDLAARSAVVEPILFLTGPEYCTVFRISKVDQRCSREYIVADSNTKVTLVLSPKLEVRIVEDPDCTGPTTDDLTCPTTTKHFGRTVGSQPEALVRVTLKNGTVSRIAELYTP